MWYVLQVQTGNELNIKNALNKLDFRAYVPRELYSYRQNGEWFTKENILFTGYVFCELDYNAENFYKIKKASKYIKFLGDKKPIPLNTIEIEWIKILANNDIPIEPISIKINNNGEAIIINNNILKVLNNKIIKINAHQNKAVFEIDLCGVPKRFTFNIIVE